LLELLEVTSPPVPVEPIGVIQGYDADSVYNSGVALAEMGYRRFAVGSLIALMRRHRYDDIRHMVAAAYEAVGSRLHVLGVTSPNLFDDFKRLGVESLDSSTPIREAVQGGIHYSHPYRRFRAPGVTPAAHDMLRSKRPGTALDRPLPCPCPVCQVDPYRLFQLGSKAAANHRSLHNYFHLKWEIEGYPEA
jgi:queuine/archaeosine tRNA-ribosyltransferase